MDIGKSFTYVFDDEKWMQKLGIGGLLLLIPGVNIVTSLFVVGYSLRVLKNVAEGTENPLPEWDNWGEDWVHGFLFVLATFIYSLPLIVLSGIVSLVSASAEYAGYEAGGDVSVLTSIGACGLSCLYALWGGAEALILPAAMINYAIEGDFGSMFRFSDLFRFVRDNFSSYIVAVLLTALAQFLASFGTILCVIGVAFTYCWAALVSVHLLGQVKAEAVSVPAAPASAYGELVEADLSSTDEEPEQS
jgi:hypothetical protein